MWLDHFVLFAPFYDFLFGFLDVAELKASLGPPAEGWLLDAGGGTGRVSKALRGLGWRIVVADQSAAMLRRSLDKGGLQAVRARIQKLPFRDASFQRIIVVDTFHHLGDQPAAAAELWRVLAPGGRLVIEEPNICRLPIKLLAAAERLALMKSCFLSPEEMGAIFRALGGKVEIRASKGMMAWVIADRRREEP